MPSHEKDRIELHPRTSPLQEGGREGKEGERRERKEGGGGERGKKREGGQAGA